jgi:hypothetical protein
MHPYIIEKLAEAHRQNLLSEAARQRVNGSRKKAVSARSDISVLAAILDAGLRGFIVVSRQTGGDPGHAPARRVYEKVDYRLLPAAGYYKAL